MHRCVYSISPVNFPCNLRALSRVLNAFKIKGTRCPPQHYTSPWSNSFPVNYCLSFVWFSCSLSLHLALSRAFLEPLWKFTQSLDIPKTLISVSRPDFFTMARITLVVAALIASLQLCAASPAPPSRRADANITSSCTNKAQRKAWYVLRTYRTLRWKRTSSHFLPGTISQMLRKRSILMPSFV